MRYRKLDAAGDMTFGHGVNDYLIDIPQAPAQAVLTRLKLFLGEWFADTAAGTAWRTKVLGRYTGPTYDPEIQARIIGTQGVTELVAYESIQSAETRVVRFRATVNTAYGPAAVEESL